MKRLYISDLDGTLLQNDATLSDFTRRNLPRLLEQGVPFTVASARAVASICPIFKDIALPYPVIEFNGGFLSELPSGKHLKIQEISKDVTPAVLAIFREHGFIPAISTYDGTTDWVYCGGINGSGMQIYFDDHRASGDRRIRDIADLRDCLTEHVMCFTLIEPFERLEPIIEAIEQLFSKDIKLTHMVDHYRPGYHWLTLHAINATKANGIQSLVEHYHWHDWELVVFGDQVNDISMFQKAHRGIAVGNAVDALKQEADLVIGTNEENSVVRFIANEVGIPLDV